MQKTSNQITGHTYRSFGGSLRIKRLAQVLAGILFGALLHLPGQTFGATLPATYSVALAWAGNPSTEVAGYHEALRALCHQYGTLLVIDETHTFSAGPGGCTAAWGLEPDLLTIGKAIGGGVPCGALGLSALSRKCETRG